MAFSFLCFVFLFVVCCFANKAEDRESKLVTIIISAVIALLDKVSKDCGFQLFKVYPNWLEEEEGENEEAVLELQSMV